MSGLEFFFMLLGVAYAAAIPFKIVDKLDGQR